MKLNTKAIIVIAVVLFALFRGGHFLFRRPAPAPPQQAMNPYGAFGPPGGAMPDMSKIAGDQAKLYQLMTQYGLNIEAASYLAQAKVQVLSQSNTSLHIAVTFPEGVIGDETITITPDVKYTPTAAELERAGKNDTHTYNVKFTARKESDTKARMTLQYFVPYSAVPADLQQKIHASSASWFQLVPSVWAQEGGEGSGMNVYEETSLELAKALLNQEAEAYEHAEKLPGPLSALMVVLKALKTGMDFNSWMGELNEIRDCAENPTNPLTKKAYDQDPTYKEKVLNGVDEARGGVESSTAMRFANLAVTTGIEKENEVLGFLIGPLSSWNNETLKQLAEQDVTDARKSVVPCEDTRPGTMGSLKYTYKRSVNLPGNIQDVSGTAEGTFELKQDPYGHTVYAGEGEGKLDWTETGKTYINSQHMHKNGDLEISLSGRGDPGDASLSLTFHGEKLTYTYACTGNCNKHSESGTEGFFTTCTFESVNMVSGGTYSAPGSDDGTGAQTSCKLKISPK
jgi:hypothetical protein